MEYEMFDVENRFYLSFLENIDKPGYYLMKDYDVRHAEDIYLMFTRTGKYDETGLEVCYGYPYANVKPPICYRLDKERYGISAKLKEFIQKNKVADHIPFTRVDGDWGWFKFTEEINIDKWLNEMDERDRKYYEERIKKGLGEVRQTSLF